MKVKIGFLFLSLAIAVAIAFAMRQRTLSGLRAGNETLRQQVEAPVADSAQRSATEFQPANAAAELSAEERSELLRLRGQVLPLQSGLQAASNRVAEFAQVKLQPPASARVSRRTTNVDSQLSPEQQAHMEVMRAYRQSPAYLNAQSFSGAFRRYLSQNGGQLPEDVAKVEAFGGADLPSGVSQRFELMHPDAIPEDARSYTLFAREKEPQQQPDGWLSRIYFFADGSMTQVGTSSAWDWTQMERNMQTRAKARAQNLPGGPLQ